MINPFKVPSIKASFFGLDYNNKPDQINYCFSFSSIFSPQTNINPNTQPKQFTKQHIQQQHKLANNPLDLNKSIQKHKPKYQLSQSPYLFNNKKQEMKNTNFEQFQRKMQKFESNTRENEYSKRILESELTIKKLQMDNSQLVSHIQAAQEQINNLREALGNIIPQNQQLKRDILSLKQLIQHYQHQSSSQTNQKDKIIQQLTTEIANMGQKEEMRKSDLSSMGELASAIEEKSRLEQQIQELKALKLIENENYEKKLVKKDQIIKGMNEQYAQVEKGLKDVIAQKINMIKSMEEELNYLKNELATTKHQKQSLVQKLQHHSSQLTQLTTQLNTTKQATLQSTHLQHQITILKQQLYQTKKQSIQHQTQAQSLTTQNQQILKQYQQLKHQSLQQKQELFSIKLENQTLEKEKQHLIQRFEEMRNKQVDQQMSVNVSKQLEMKQHYIDLLQESRKQLSNNQIELKNTFALLQTKVNQLKLKQNQISQLKSSISNYQHYQTYFENSNKDLQQDKTNLLNKLAEKDQYIRGHQNRVQQMGKEIYKLRKRIQELQKENSTLIQEKQQLTQQLTLQQPPIQQKNSPIQHFYDCNNQKQLLQQQLRQTKKSLLQQKQKSSSYENEVHKLKSQLEIVLRSSQEQQTSPVREGINVSGEVKTLKEENRKLGEKLNERNMKLEEKTRKFQILQREIKAEYEGRIKALEKEIYRLTVEGQNNTKPNQVTSSIPQLQKTDNLLIDDLDNQFQLQLQQKNPSPHLSIQRQLNSYNSQPLSKQSPVKLSTNDQLPQSKKSISSESDRGFKLMYEELRVQNDSLQAHLQRLSALLAQTKEQLNIKDAELKRLNSIVGQKRPSQQSQHLQTRISQLQRQLSQSKEQLQRFSSLKQLLKLQKSQSTQKSATIKQLQDQLKKLNKTHKQLHQDYFNLESLNEQTNEKYKKTLQQFKKEMSEMNEEILKEKERIDEKKKQMKRLENEYMGKINLYEDENMGLRSKVKKLQLCITKMQERVKELQEQQIQKVIITRTQLVNYKQTQKRLEQLQEQINILLRDKDKVINQKKSIEMYYIEEIALLRTNFSSQRQKLLKKLTQLEEIKTQTTLKLQKTKEILQTKRKQLIQIEQSFQRTAKQNYDIKLELSSALSQTNTHLMKNKALGQRIQQLESELEDVKMGFEGIVAEKSKYDKDRIAKHGYKVQLQMAYKQIERLNELLMEKEKQINYFLTYCPTPDKTIKYDPYSQKQRYSTSIYEQANRPRKGSRQYSYAHQNPFPSQQSSQSHYKSTKNLYSKQNDFVKETLPYNKSTYAERTSIQNPQGAHYQRKTSQMQFYSSNLPNEKYIGGFPPQYCTFAPEYHKI